MNRGRWPPRVASGCSSGTNLVRAWTTARTTAEIVALASDLRIPVAEVNNGRTVLDHPQFVARGVWAEYADGSFTHPLPPYRIDGERPVPFGLAPKLGEHQHAVEQRPPRPLRRSCAADPAARRRADRRRHRLVGGTILRARTRRPWRRGDPSRVDPTPRRRAYGGAAFVSQAQWWERSAMFLGTNTNKRDSRSISDRRRA